MRDRACGGCIHGHPQPSPPHVSPLPSRGSAVLLKGLPEGGLGSPQARLLGGGQGERCFLITYQRWYRTGKLNGAFNGARSAEGVDMRARAGAAPPTRAAGARNAEGPICEHVWPRAPLRSRIKYIVNEIFEKSTSAVQYQRATPTVVYSVRTLGPLAHARRVNA